MKIWKINGLELLLDMEDADTVERYESAFDRLSKAETEVKKETRLSAQIREYCKIFRELYDNIFGDGTAEKIFENVPDNCTEYDKVYCNFLDFVRTQKMESAQRRNGILAKYSPNRQQRRHKNK